MPEYTAFPIPRRIVDVNALQQASADAVAAAATAAPVAGIVTQINTVASIAADVTTVAGVAESVPVVAGLAPDFAAAVAAADNTAADRVQTGLDRTATAVDAVATAADRVQTGLDAASAFGAAGTATTQASNAASSANNAANSAAAAATSETNSANSAASLTYATQVEAEAGAVGDRVMSPLLSRQGLVAARAIGRDVHAWLSGVVADGVTDNRAALQNIIAGLGSAGGGIVRLPAGVIMLNSANSVNSTCLEIPSNVSLEGIGQQATILRRGAGVVGHIVNVLNNQHISISKMTLDGNKQADTQGALPGLHAIRGGGAGFINLDRLRITNALYYGIGLQGSEAFEETLRLTDIDMFDCGGWGSGGPTLGDGIDIKSGRRMWLTRVRIVGSAQKNFDIRCRDLFLTDCYSQNATQGGFAIRTRGDLATDLPAVVRISGCHAEGSGGNGFEFAADSQILRGSITVANSYAAGNTGSGFSVLGNPSDVAYAGCMSLSNTGSGFRSEAHGTTYGACHAENNGGWGIDNNGLARRHVIVGNTVRGNTAGQIRANASAVIANNITT